MKKFLISVIVLLSATMVMADISGSPHDFSAEAWAANQICLPCHTPHGAMGSIGTPLWNHEVTAAVFTLYSTSTLDATDVAQPAGVSKLCLSCHDGTVAIDSYGGATGTNYVTTPLGNDLSNDHPISFTYDAALATADGGLFDPTTAASGLGGTIDADMLFSEKLECSSCHDVHNEYNLSALLLIDNNGSALCMTCHDK